MFSVFAFVAVTLAVSAAAPSPANIFQIDISPEEAQKYLNSLPFTEPKLAGRTATLPLVRYDSPQFRAAEAGPTLGHYWRNGQEIENTQDYVEEVYDASQYHGQDGLGAFAYGYETPESSKVENRVRSGDVTGSYTYKVPGTNELYKVRYWADSQGFHQEDNRPKVELQPAQETEEVRQARMAHEKAWIEAANAARMQPDPQGEYVAAASEPEEARAAASEPSAAVEPALANQRLGRASYQAQAQASFQPQAQQGQYQGQQGQYQQQGQAQKQQQGSYEEPEPTGPPRGFFYSYNYPVSIIVPKNEQHAGQNVDHDTVGVSSQRF